MSSAPATLATVRRPLAFMEKLNRLVFFYCPSNASSTGADHQPRLIIVSSWTDAKDVHTAKYVTKYQVLYPAAQILLLKSTMSSILRPSQIGPAMQVAASVVRAAFQTPAAASPSSPPLLIHIFSNGGSSSVANLYEQFATTAGPGQDKHLPPHATVFDSSPGLYHMPQVVAFFSVGLSSVQRLIAVPLIYVFVAFYIVCIVLGLLPNSLGNWYKSHNENEGNEAEMRRVYIYSRADALIHYKDIEKHAAEARTKGFSVSMERFERSAHVAHLREDESRYWEIVRKAIEG